MATKNDDATLRVRALELAIAAAGSPEQIVDRAAAYIDFIQGVGPTGRIAPPTPTASPLAEPEGEIAPRLDAPEVVAEAQAELAEVEPTPDTTTPAVTESPTLTDAAVSSTTSPDAAAAVSPSVPEQPAAVAPAAEPSQFDVAKLNEAVLKVAKVVGRDQAVAAITAAGGTNVPSVPVANHASLFAALNALLPADQQVTL